MEEDNSNGIQLTENDPNDEEIEEKPLMQLFKRLIGHVNKQNTVLTNVQIMNILEEEFSLDTSTLHKLEIDIYLNVMKKFLKEWPQWDNFDSTINLLRSKNDEEKIQQILRTKYHHLKKYLMVMLEAARPLAKKKVLLIEEKQTNSAKTGEVLTENIHEIEMEIHATRPQLNKLFYRHPHPEENYTLFSARDCGPSTIILGTPEYDALLNWWNINININMKSLGLTRSTVHEVKHVLVNKKLNVNHELVRLKECFQKKANYSTTSKDYRKSKIVSLLNHLKVICQETDYNNAVTLVVDTIQKDIEGLPKKLNLTYYRKYFSKYPYKRYLYTDVPEAKDDDMAKKYDIQLEETVSPMYQLHLVRFESRPLLSIEVCKAIQIECKLCSLKFNGADMLHQLKDHIWLNHLNEPDWQCANCKKILSMVTLAKERWIHLCDE